jgi:hypothetical protein
MGYLDRGRSAVQAEIKQSSMRVAVCAVSIVPPESGLKLNTKITAAARVHAKTPYVNIAQSIVQITQL